MLVDLRGQGGARDRLLFTCQATVPAVMILVTTVSCATPDMPQPRAGIIEREQPRTATSPKVATVHAPKETGAASRQAQKKVNTPPQHDAKKEQQLFQEFEEFLEWRRRQRDPP